MFNIGDKVVYPMHGAGVIEAIEDKEILGAKKKYYVMNMPLGGIKVMIPLDNVEKVGLRDVIVKSAVEQVFNILESTEEEPANGNWNRRYRANMDKIKSGNIYKVAEVARSLLIREEEKGLSSGERRMLESTRQILASELLMVKGIDRDEVAGYLEKLFNHRHNWTKECSNGE
ncbi:MAG: CarD family transcriptional regulator [Bacillota bacterium]